VRPYRYRLAVALVCLLTLACDSPQIRALRSNTLGVAYMNLQQVEEALAAFRQARELDPTLGVAQLNEAIALFNLQRYEEAEAILLRITSDRPDDVRAWYNLGLIYRNTGRSEDGERAFAEAVRIDPASADSWYLLGLMRYNLQDYPGAIEAYEEAIARNAFHYSAEYGLFLAMARSGRTDEAQAHNDRRLFIEDQSLGVPIGTAYGDQGPYSTAVDAAEAIAYAPEPIEVRFVPTDAVAFIHARAETGDLAGELGSGACFLDVDADGQVDLLFQNGAGPPALYRNRNGRFGSIENALPTLPSNGTGCTAGDFDNDLDIDLALGFRDGVRLLANDGTGRFTDVSAAAGVEADGLTLGLTFIDFDHDGDVDLYAARFPNLAVEDTNLEFPDDLSAPGNLLWRNNGDGTFTDWTRETALGGDTAGVGAVGSDLNNDRAIDFVTTGNAGPEVYLNPREGAFDRLAWSDPMPATAGVAVVDFNKDSWMDLVFTHWGRPGITLWRNVGGVRFDPEPLPDSGWLRGWGVTTLDYDNDGWIDLAALGETDVGGEIRVYRNRGREGFEDVSEALGLANLALTAPRALLTADHDGDGDTDLLLTQSGGPALLLDNEGGNSNGWLRLTLEGLNDNRSGIGAKIEVFAGAHRQKTEIYAGSGYLGQNALPLTAGLGQNAPVDTIRMLWPTGVFQDEIQLATRTSHLLHEIDRRGSSCPVLFAWDGHTYDFVTDMIGAGVVGHWVGPGQRNVSDPTEYVRVAGSRVEARDGRLSFRLAEPMEELVYLDHVRLLAIDHPEGVQVYPNEYFAGAPPFPEFRVLTSDAPQLPRGAWDDSGKDVLEELRAIDGRYVQDLPPAPFKGFRGTHTLELDVSDIDTTGPLRLLMHGYVDYFSATSLYAAHQAGVEPVMPYIEARNISGAWVRVVDDLGFPAGLARTMTRDITGRLPAGTTRLRITTNLRIYWDQILFDTSRDSPVRLAEVPLDRANLKWLGYPRAEEGELPGDIRYRYDEVSLTGPYARHAGDYTRYGPVDELLAVRDERFAIFGSGEEVAMEFDPSDLPSPEAGWTRDYFFYADGFSKDMDFYEAHAATVGPLPVHTEEPYPYPSGLRYPSTPPYIDYLIDYNTRPVSGGPQAAYRFQYPGD
jgi:tetratricopeptide (TPR) repeat protein